MERLKFYFDDLQSPTCHQLYQYLLLQNWQSTQYIHDACFSSVHLDYPQLEVLEFKHLLSQMLAPDLLWIQPRTLYLDDWNALDVLDKTQKESAHSTQPWILKPSLLNNGQHIKIFKTIEEVYSYYLQTNRLGGPHVLQEYIVEPHLLKGPEYGHKYSLRLFMIMTESKAFLYPHGYFNIALKPYVSNDFSNLACHLTNEHLTHDVSNVIQIPTEQYPIFQKFFPQIIKITSALAKKFFSNHVNFSTSKLGILGMDFMVDSQERVWLLETNHGPCFPIEESHPLYYKLYDGFWRALILEIITPRYAEKKAELNHFVALID
jgi:tubulin--tyrosine ligase